MPALASTAAEEVCLCAERGFPVNSTYAGRFLRFAFSMVFGMVPLRAAAEAPAPQAPLELTAANLASVIDPLAAKWIDKHKGPGGVVVVVTRDGPVFARGYGFADIEARKPFTADSTLVRPGSISKLFTGIAVMQLVDDGRLDLDRDVSGYIDFAIPVPEGGVPVTLRRLLTHRAGFEEHLKGLFSRDREPEPLGRWLAKNLPRRLFPGGDVEAYSNYGLALAGYIVERVSGEPFAAYVQRHILYPLGMSHSTFRQPLPEDLAPLMAKGYRTSDKPPLGFFETIAASPAGALSATGTDMGRFIRALMNGGALDGVRILSQARLEEMTAPRDATPAGYLGLVFFGTKVAGHDAIGHDGGTMAFFSNLRFFPEQGVGIFISRNGMGEIRAPGDIPNPMTVIADRFLPKVPENPPEAAGSFSGDAGVAGIYRASRRAESSVLRLNELMSQVVVRIDSAGDLRLSSAVWPFAKGQTFKRVDRNVYEGPGARVAFVNDAGSESHITAPATRFQRVPWSVDVRWIAPALAVSAAVVFLTLLAWPFVALWRRWRGKQWSPDRGDRFGYLTVRLVLLVDAVVIVAPVALFRMSLGDLTILNDPLDPVLLAIYAVAWLGVFGAIPVVWTAALFWRDGVGSRWSRVHHTLIAASSVMLAWFFVTFRIAGTTLNY
jgi:CubicO group peptidase (beta-lactamase class C family)